MQSFILPKKGLIIEPIIIGFDTTKLYARD